MAQVSAVTSGGPPTPLGQKDRATVKRKKMSVQVPTAREGTFQKSW